MSRRPSRPRRLRRGLTGRAAATVDADLASAAAGGIEAGRPRVRARGAPDLLGLIPYQLGFHPEESIVVTFVQGRRIRLTARMDLPAVSSAAACARWVRELARQHGADEIVLFAYSVHAAPARELLAELVRVLPRRLLNEALYVDGSRWWSMTCGPECCPAEGTPYEVEGHRLAAEAVFAGMTTRGSRAELAALLTGPPASELDRLADLADEVRAEQGTGCAVEVAAARVLELVVAGLGEPAGLDERASAELGLLFTDLRLRDLAWSMMNPDNAEECLRLWRQLIGRVTPGLAAAPLGLAGIAAWIGGDGALLNCAADELARRHPDYSMGGLLAEMSLRAVPPRLWGEIQAEMQAELGIEVRQLAG